MSLHELSPLEPAPAQLEQHPVDDVEIARAQEYMLLSALLRGSPDSTFLSRIARISGDETPIGRCHFALARAAAQADAEKIEREYFDLLVGVGRGKLMPYASYYLTGFLHGRPLARLRADLDSLGIERHGEVEPEDHAGTLCEIMAGLIDGRLAAARGADRAFFQRHVAAWLGRFFADLERAEASDFYRHVGTLGRVFVNIETQAMALGG